MPDSPSTRLQLRLQDYNSNPETWGAPNLNVALQGIDDAVAGIATVSATTSTVTLTSTNYTSNQSRMAGLTFTGTPGADFSVIAPSVSKIYFTRNLTASGATVRTSLGTGPRLSAGYRAIIFGDGLDFRAFTPEVADVAGLLRMSGVASANGPNQAVTFGNNLSQFGAPTGNIAMGGFTLTGLPVATASGQPVTFSNGISDLAAPTGNVAMGGFRLVNTGSATTSGMPLTFSNRLDQLSPPAASVPFNSQRITGLAAAAAGTDATNLDQVSAAIAAAGSATAGSLLVTVSDTTPGFLGGKVVGAGAATLSVINPGGDEELQISVPIDLAATTTTALAAPLTLTWSGNQVQHITPTADAAAVNLPPLSGFPATAGAVRIINNRGAYPIPVRDNAGTTIVGWAMPGQSMTCFVHDQTGTPRWVVVGQSKDECHGVWSFPVGNNLLNAQTDVLGAHAVWLTATRFVLLTPNGASSMAAAVGEITGGNIRLGETSASLGSSIQSGTNGATWNVTPIGSTGDFLFTFVSTPGSDTLNARVCSVNATTLAVTVNAAATLAGSGAGSIQSCDVTALTSSTFLCVFCGSYTSQRARTVVISVSGTTTTINTPADIVVAGSTNNMSVMALSATIAVATFTNAATGFTSAVRISVSSVTATVGVVVAINAVTNFCPVGLWHQSATTILAAYVRSINSQNRLCFRLLTDNATTTIQVGSEQDVAAVNGDPTLGRGAVIPFSPISAIYMDFVAGQRHMAIKLNSASGTVSVRGTGLMYMNAGGDASGGGQTPRPRATYPINVAGKQGIGRIERFGTTYLANFELLYVSEAQL
jgi:hypothetical protein